MRIAVLFVTFLLVATSAKAADAECTQRSLRTVLGPPRIANELRIAATKAADLFFKAGHFDEERFAYVGMLELPSGKSWRIALLETTWGCAGRSTPRMLVFSSNGQYLGQFSHFSGRQVRIESDSIVFKDLAQEVGNKITFSEAGPPARVLIDGENHSFYR
jgi:hypothetical protein